MEVNMNSNLLKRVFIGSFIILVSTAGLSAGDLEIGVLIKSALTENADLRASDLEVAAEKLQYESVLAGALPSIGFTTDNGTNPLYKYSNSDEFSSTSFSTSRYQRHKIGAGLNIGLDLPTGGNLSVSGTGNLDFSLAEGADDWNYLASPALSLYFRQPLFTDRLNGSPLRFDSMELAGELAQISYLQASQIGTALENSLLLSVVRTSIILNNLNASYEILQQRLELAQSRIELLVLDEQAGRLNRLDLLEEELLIRRQREALIEFDFQIRSMARDLENLTGLKGLRDARIVLGDFQIEAEIDVNPYNSINVKSSDAIRRSIELAGTVVPDGSEPVFELSGLLRRSDQSTSDNFDTAVNDAFSSKMDFSLSMAVSIPALDWGESSKKKKSDEAALSAAENRLSSAKAFAELQMTAALEELQLIEEKFILLKRSLEYDNSLLERENLRLDAGLTSKVAVETIKLDKQEREYQIQQLSDEKILAVLELYNTGGIELKNLF